MIKTFFKLLLATVLFSVLFTVANALMPFSQGFKELGSSENPLALLFLLISSAWTCFSIYFLIKHTGYYGKKLFLILLFVFFFVQYFMTQIETLFFGHAFTALTKYDIILLMLSGLFPLLGVTALLVKFFQNKNIVQEREKINIKDIIIKLGIIGIIYLCIYMIFGYFVAWQFEELRMFYSGSSEKLGFWGQMANNIKSNPVIIPFQIIRGILFGMAIIPIKNMLSKNKIVFKISVCLIYLCTAIVLIIPNVLFPDMVRIAHLIEMSSSMLLFGIIVGNILWSKK
ncbi:hypothetical protein R84B8_01341 [Treponema sp. R8-4-B8]